MALMTEEGSQEIKEECKSKEREAKVYLIFHPGIQNLCLETHQSVSDTEQKAVSDLHGISVSKNLVSRKEILITPCNNLFLWIISS